jgi:NitT/TauT family transport system ATP-binding protein
MTSMVNSTGSTPPDGWAPGSPGAVGRPGTGSGAVVVGVEGLGHVYPGHTQPVLHDVSFAVCAGELVTIVGPSGTGKSTLLRCVAGLLKPATGTVSVLGTSVNGIPADLAMVFQDYSRSLFPWMRVGRNVGFPLRAAGVPKAERRELERESLAAVGLEGAEHKFPWQLSGGMQQRVAIARALACRPSVLLMDEPFASVDAQTRCDLEDLTLDVRARFGMTVLVVTHDIDESVYLSDRIIVLSRPPATVSEQIEIALPVPRDQITTRSAPRFVDLRTEVAAHIRDGGRPAGSPRPSTPEPNPAAGAHASPSCPEEART